MVKPEMFVWARDRAGFSLDALTPRFPKLPEWERGKASPTLKQLESFAKATYTPIGYLFLPEPPIERVPIPDFRTVAGRHINSASPDLLDTVYLCQQRQDWYRNFARSIGEPALPFVGSARPTGDAAATAAEMRHTLGFDIEERRRLASGAEALRRFIEQAESLGVLVMVSGVVGSNNRRQLDPEEFRGFALADDLAPLVFINGADTKAAQMFTLAHELAHVWLGQTALTDTQAFAATGNQVEIWCNRVAAELLVPLDVLRTELNRKTDLRTEIDRLARRFKVSTLVILRRIFDAGGLPRDEYSAAYAAELSRLDKVRKDGGGDFYRTLGARVSKRFARALVVSTWEGQSSFTEAFRLLGFHKMSTFRDLGHSLGLGV